MLKLKCFKAGKGDSFLLQWGIDYEQNLLIDAGIEGTYRFIYPTLSGMRNLKAILVTHVDYDHIGGFFKLLKDDNDLLSQDIKVYINTPSLILYPSETDLVSIDHGVEFAQVLHQKEIEPIGIYLGKNFDNLEIIHGLALKIISPSKEVLMGLISKWTASQIYIEYEKKKMQQNDMVASNIPQLRSIAEIIKSPPKAKNWEDDLLNSSSISFIASFNSINILFLADANPTLICEELRRLGYTKENQLIVDLVKLSHHGSKHNTTIELLELIKCRKYLISTDGTAPYNHPNRETIILISEYGRENKSIPLTFYCNYDLDLDFRLTLDEQKNLNLNFEVIDELEFPLQ